MIKCLDTGKMMSVAEVIAPASTIPPGNLSKASSMQVPTTFGHHRSLSTDLSVGSGSVSSNTSTVSVASADVMEDLEHASSNVIVVDTFEELSSKVSNTS